jgi:hypothetical protein
MARIQTQAQTTDYGSALSLQAGTTNVEVSFLASGALVAGTIKIKDPGDNAIEIPIGANQSYSFSLPKGSAAAGSGWLLELKAASGTPTGQVLES